MHRETPNSFKDRHQEQLVTLTRGVRARSHDPIYFLGGSCPNSASDIRDVLVRVRSLDERVSFREFRCPSCRNMLSFGGGEFEVEAKTRSEFYAQLEQAARDSVQRQLHEERLGTKLLTVGEALSSGTTLDKLQDAFAKRRAGAK